jgi:hypothetical protein
MVARTSRLVAITAALAAGALFVLAVRTVGLHELAQRSHCESPMQSECTSTKAALRADD